MTKGRLEAFSDAVVAIIMTIMVLELRPPHEPTIAAMRPLIPVFLSYVLSFIFLGIYWSNHHHLIQAVRHVDGRVLWANLHLLFWLSLIPFGTAWMGETHFRATPVAVYGAVLLAAAISYAILVRTLIARHGRESAIALAVGRDFKGWLSIVLYVVALMTAYVQPLISCAIYVGVAIMWLVPDPRIERTLMAGAADRKD
jgi:uncharacterized membrane protein